MKIGTVISIFDKNWQQNYKPLLKEKFSHFEILPENSNFYTIKTIKKFFKGREIIIHAPFIESNLISQVKDIREASYKYLNRIINPFMREFSCKVITLHIGHTSYIYNNYCFDQINKLINKFPNIAIENLPKSNNLWRRSFPGNISEFDLVLSKVKCQITLDVGHWLSQGVDPTQLLDQYRDRIINIHIHDFDGTEDHQQIDSKKLIVRKFLNKLRQIKYQGYLTIELLPNNINGVISSYKIIEKIIK